jgi:CheY-like chemotaxis protein
MRSPQPAHEAFFYTSQEAYFDHVVNFIGAGARGGERVLVITTDARWSGIAARLAAAGIDSSHAAGRRSLVVINSETMTYRVLVDGVFERARLDAAIPLLLFDTVLPQRVYGDAAGDLASGGNLPAALALEHAVDTILHESAIRISCGYDLQHLPEVEHDWRVRSVINAHNGFTLEQGAWTGHVRRNGQDRTTKDAELILLWDDYQDTRNMYAEALTFNGYRVMTAANASDTLTLATAYRPALLVIDVRLPSKVGAMMMRTLRGDHHFTGPILALTGHAFEAEREEISGDGFDAVLSKPCLPHALVAAVTDALDRPWSRREAQERPRRRTSVITSKPRC